MLTITKVLALLVKSAQVVVLGSVTSNKLRQVLTQVVVLGHVLGNTAGFVCFQTLKNEVAGFRVAATGVTGRNSRG